MPVSDMAESKEYNRICKDTGTKDVGIVTFNNANNYGAFCQEYALQTWIVGQGYSVNVLNLENEQFDQYYRY